MQHLWSPCHTQQPQYLPTPTNQLWIFLMQTTTGLDMEVRRYRLFDRYLQVASQLDQVHCCLSNGHHRIALTVADQQMWCPHHSNSNIRHIRLCRQHTRGKREMPIGLLLVLHHLWKGCKAWPLQPTFLPLSMGLLVSLVHSHSEFGWLKESKEWMWTASWWKLFLLFSLSSQ